MKTLKRNLQTREDVKFMLLVVAVWIFAYAITIIMIHFDAGLSMFLTSFTLFFMAGVMHFSPRLKSLQDKKADKFIPANL